jgi:hypothetical protein
MERVKRWKEKVLGSCWSDGGDSSRRLGHWLVVLAGSACLVGCATVKKMAIVSGTTLGVGALAGAVTGGTAPALLAASGAAGVTSAIVSTQAKAQPILLQTEQGMIECAPDNFFSLLQSVVEYGSWFLILIFVVPMLLGWILPGPLEKKRKQNP